MSSRADAQPSASLAVDPTTNEIHATNTEDTASPRSMALPAGAPTPPAGARHRRERPSAITPAPSVSTRRRAPHTSTTSRAHRSCRQCPDHTTLRGQDRPTRPELAHAAPHQYLTVGRPRFGSGPTIGEDAYTSSRVSVWGPTSDTRASTPEQQASAVGPSSRARSGRAASASRRASRTRRETLATSGFVGAKEFVIRPKPSQPVGGGLRPPD